MSNPTKNNHINFQFKNIEVLDFSLNFPGKLINELDTFHFDIQIQHRINEANNLLIVDTSFTIFHKNKTTKLGSFKMASVYVVENLLDYKTNDKNKLTLPDDFVTTVNSISLSTARGVMYSHFKGTFLHGAMLPIVDPKAFLPNIQ